MNHLYFGDNLEILKQLYQQHPDGFIDLVYIDPPFNSKRDYNILFENVDVKDSTAQKQAFADTWSNVSYYDTLQEIQEIDLDLYNFISSLDNIRISKSAVAYLTTMAIRLWYIHKILNKTGSFYLHCDSSMSHYLKILCDLIFGENNYQNEIIWQRTTNTGSSKSLANKFSSDTDTILYYTKSNKFTFNKLFREYGDTYMTRFKYEDENGSYRWQAMKTYSKEKVKELEDKNMLRWTKTGKPEYKQYADKLKGVPMNNLWHDIYHINPMANERLGYPTQKPEALLERIIKVSSNEGDLIADFFCGCGTTIAVAQRLKRKWIGVDISNLAVKLIYRRLLDPYRANKEKLNQLKEEIHITGIPVDLASAKSLARDTKQGRLSFQDWIIEMMIGGVCNPKKTADGGWDGHITFNINDKKHNVLIEVKSGNVNVKNLREFIQVVNKQKASIGVFVCFKEQVTKPMIQEAKQQGYFEQKTWNTKYDKIQILTVEDLLNGEQVKMPYSEVSTFKKASKLLESHGQQTGMFE